MFGGPAGGFGLLGVLPLGVPVGGGDGEEGQHVEDHRGAGLSSPWPSAGPLWMRSRAARRRSCAWRNSPRVWERGRPVRTPRLPGVVRCGCGVRTCLTTWLNHGIPLAQVAEWAGNSVPVLLSTYARCITGQTIELQQRIEGPQKLPGVPLAPGPGGALSPPLPRAPGRAR